MAIVAGRWWTTVVLVEGSGKPTTKRYQHNNPADYAAAKANEAALIAALEPITDLVISAHYTYQEFVENALVLPAGAEKENQALLTFQLKSSPLKKATHIIPRANIGIFTATSGDGKDIVDTNDADLIVYRDLFRGATPTFLISDGEEGDSLIGGKRRHTANKVS